MPGDGEYYEKRIENEIERRLSFMQSLYFHAYFGE